MLTSFRRYSVPVVWECKLVCEWEKRKQNERYPWTTYRTLLSTSYTRVKDPYRKTTGGTSHTVPVIGEIPVMGSFGNCGKYRKQNRYRQASLHEEKTVPERHNECGCKEERCKFHVCGALIFMVPRVKTRTMTQDDSERLEAFEMWVWRRMLKISWVDKCRNSSESTRKQEHF